MRTNPNPSLVARFTIFVWLFFGVITSAQESLTEVKRQELISQRDMLLRQAQQLFNAAKLVDAAEDFRKVLEIEKRVFGNTDAEVAGTLGMLAQIYQTQSDFEGEQKVLEEIVNIRQQTFGPNAWQTREATLDVQDQLRRQNMSPQEREELTLATRLHKEVRKMYQAGRSQEAITSAVRVVEIRKRLLGEKHRIYGVCLDTLAGLYISVGEYAKAELLYLQARDISQNALGKDHPDSATSANNLASLYQAMDRYDDAELMLLEARDTYKNAGSEYQLDYAVALSNLGYHYKQMGEYSKAEPLYTQAREIFRNALGESHPNFAASLNNLATLYMSMGEYAKAEPLYEQAREITKKALTENHPQYASLLNNFGRLYQLTGEYAKAEPLLLKSRDIRRSTVGEQNLEYATTLHNLAWVYQSMGQYAKAEPLYLKSRDIRKKIGVKHRDYASSLNNLATMYYEMKEYKKAESLCLEAQEIFKGSLGEEHPDYAIYLQNLAWLYLWMGEYDKAKLLYGQAQAITRSFLEEDHYCNTRILNDLALLYQSIGEFGNAESSALEGIYKEIAAARKLLPSMSHSQALAWIAENTPHIDVYLSEADNVDPKPTANATRAACDSRALATRLFAGQRPGRHASQKVKQLFDELQVVRKQLSQLALTIPDPREQEHHRSHIVQVSEKKETLERQLAAINDATARGLVLRDATMADLVNILPADASAAMLLQSYSWKRVQSPENQVEDSKAKFHLERERVYELFVIRRDEGGHEKLIWEHLGPTDPIDAAVVSWRKHITEHPRSRIDNSFGQRFRELVWEKIEPHVMDCQTVIIIPEGRLTAVPWAALPGRQPGTVLLEDYALATASYPQQLVDWLQRESSEASGLTLVGGVEHNQRPASAGPSTDPPASASSIQLVSAERSAAVAEEGRFWKDLKGTQQEAEQIAKLFGELKQGAPTYLSGQQASEEAVAGSMQHSRYIHLATHGFFAKEKETDVFTQDLRRHQLFATELSGLHRSGSLAGRNPLLLTGVTLSGANLGPVKDDYGVPSGEDGILTAEEVESLDLEEAELVVLSACETGLGEGGYQGEGIFGLQRAFHQAGARTVVASLWKVEDQATQALMVEFYRNLWEKKLPKLEALRQAQLTMLKQYNPEKGQIERGAVKRLQPKSAQEKAKSPPSESADGNLAPYYWAPFVLSGDWR